MFYLNNSRYQFIEFNIKWNAQIEKEEESLYFKIFVSEDSKRPNKKQFDSAFSGVNLNRISN